ncbi:MAG: threonine ammonia-lyase, biosynthetic [Myxococcales bacterium]|nr:threonine ammonia-lyase, biosynthetic [Myxococcales bacterium]MCB9733733.1 threonine ammonia-lyase, biosynthetic [Deltaproteobacteria bacterium]
MEAIVKKILRAPVYDVAVETPLEHAPVLSRRLDNHVYLKREDLQPVFSFKLRGAYAKLVAMGESGRGRGVIAASAGNHAQGVALAASRLGTRAVIVMPVTTPSIKVAAVRSRGGEVVLHGDTFDEARRHAEELGAAEGLAFVHPYDDDDVIAGQGTVGMEILRQHRGAIDAIFVPVGGGGLIAGIAAYVKYVAPETAIIGVEPEDAACLAAALAAKRQVTLPTVGIFADGVAVARVGDAPWRIAREHVDRVVTVTTDQICAAVRDLFDDTRSIAEPAGALAVAGLKRFVEETGVTGRRFVAIDSGANVNFDRLRHISERAEIGEEREAILAVTIPERPGAFRRFCEAIGRRNITEFNYRIHDADAAHIYVGVTLSRGGAERRELAASLGADGYAVADLTESELAKLHIRHMVGGRSAAAVHERVYRFEFPERPGALMRFLERLSAGWNISMFHYRNDGAAFGRVVVGMQVPPDESAAWDAALADIGYPFWEETDEPAYRLFLGPV